MNNPIPQEALGGHIAIVGKTGSGKSYAAKGVVEGLLELGRRVCIIDPTGAWWGLKSSASGKSAGFAVVVFGGEHADVPITENAGGPLGELVGKNNLPCVIDLSGTLLAERRRFMGAFAEHLYRTNRQPLHLIVDEADEFSPQEARGLETVIGHMDRIVRRGRVKGFRVMLITQRPAVLNKNVLTQCNTLVAMRLPAPQDRKAVGEWIHGQADDEKGKEVVDSLPRLQKGEGWVWAPEQDVLKRVTFPNIRTFDSGRTPEDGEAIEAPRTLAQVDLDGVRTALQEATADAAANDPKMLRARIAELEGELETAKTQSPVVDEAAVVHWKEEAERASAEVTALRASVRAATETAHWRQVAEANEILNRAVTGGLAALEAALNGAHAATLAAGPARAVPTKSVPGMPPNVVVVGPLAGVDPTITNGRLRNVVNRGSLDGEALPVGERAILTAIAQSGTADTSQISVLTGYKRSSRDAYLARLRAKGYVDGPGEAVKATPAGIRALGNGYQPLPTGQALRAYWRARLPEGESVILELICAAYPKWIPCDAAGAGYKRSSRDAYISRLQARKLVERQRGEVRAADRLF